MRIRPDRPPHPRLGRALRCARSSGFPAAPAAASFLLLLACGLPITAEAARDGQRLKFRVLFSSTLFQNVNRGDALAAFQLWIDTVIQNRGLPLEAQVDSYDRLEDADQRIRDGAVDLVVFNTLEYLRSTETDRLDPLFVAERQKKTIFDDYLVVSRRDRNLTCLADLRGKNIIFYKYGAELGRLWMDVRLGEGGLGKSSDFFASISTGTKPTEVVLPVFFGKSDACVVNRSGLEIMQEMNPGLAAQLQVQDRSPGLPESVICMHKLYDLQRDAVLDGLTDLQSEPRGQQILLIFKINRLVPFESAQLAGVQDLVARHARLNARMAKGTDIGGVVR